MKLVQQPLKIKILNLDQKKSVDSIIRKKHGNLLPDTVRCIIVGPSNCGKTNVMVSLLIDENGLKFENVYVYSKSLQQEKYRLLAEILNGVGSGLGYHTFTDSETIMRPNEAKQNSIFIFDDVACENQSNIREYFSMGRHASVDSFYLCQSYSRIPKQLVRDNANFIVLFKQDDMNLRHAYDDYVNTDMTFQEFKNLCSECWAENKYNFFVIDRDSDLNAGRYRVNFDKFIQVKPV